MVYKTTNTINGKFYIGKHQARDINDGYMGSGKLIKNAIRKYGKHNFIKDILHICGSIHEMNMREKILVVPDRETNYNLTRGGYGDFLVRDDGITHFQAKLKDKNFYDKWYQSVIDKANDPEVRKRISISLKERYKNNTSHWVGKKHKEETKTKMSEAAIRYNRTGVRNPAHGTCWITNGSNNKMIKVEELQLWIENGYKKGRVI